MRRTRLSAGRDSPLSGRLCRKIVGRERQYHYIEWENIQDTYRSC